MLNNRRVLAHYVVFSGIIYINSILIIDCGGNVTIEPFVYEMAATEFTSGIVVVCDKCDDIEWLYTECQRGLSMPEIAKNLSQKDINKSHTPERLLKIQSNGQIQIEE